MRRLQTIALYTARALGGFRLAQYLTRRRLRILCYHGFSLGDEHEVMPNMFMRASTFERRMQILRKRRIPVISLDEAVSRMQSGEIRRGETVITLDDGWMSNLTIGVPILEKHGCPATIYVTTEHLSAGTEVFNVALDYMIRRSSRTTLVLQGLHPLLDGTFDLHREREKVIVTLIGAAKAAFPRLSERQHILHRVSSALNIDLTEMLSGERFRLLTSEQIERLSSRGVDIQLHSHTHNLPAQDFQSTAAEIEENRRALRPIIGRDCRHFCFPSGQYSQQHPEWLKQLGIASAVTCDPGLNAPGSSLLLLKRYLDSDHISDIAFEAEISGIRELARNARSLMTRLGRKKSKSTGSIARSARSS